MTFGNDGSYFPPSWGTPPPMQGGMNRGLNIGGHPIPWSSPDPGSPNPTGPGPFDPGGGPGAPTLNYDPRRQTPWQRKNAGHGDTSTTLDPKTYWDTHPNKARAQRLVDRQTQTINDRRDQMFPGWRSQPYDPNAPWNAPPPGQNLGMAPGDARLVGHVFGNRLPPPQDGTSALQQLFGHPAYNPGRGVLR